MDCWIIYDVLQYQKNEWFALELKKELQTFCHCEIIIVEKLKFGIKDNKPYFFYDGKEISLPQFAIQRCIFPLLSVFLESQDVRLFNNTLITQICNDKRLTYTYILNSGIPVMNSFFFTKEFINESSFNDIKFPKILKSDNGHGGSEVFMLDSETGLRNSINLINSHGFVLQDVCNTTGKDLRVYILNNSILAAVLRTSDNFKSNYSLGGHIEKYTLNNEEKTVVNKILNILPTKADLIGIDFLLDGNTLVFNEIEDIVGTRMLYETTNIDIIKLYAEHIKSEVFDAFHV